VLHGACASQWWITNLSCPLCKGPVYHPDDEPPAVKAPASPAAVAPDDAPPAAPDVRRWAARLLLPKIRTSPTSCSPRASRDDAPGALSPGAPSPEPPKEETPGRAPPRRVATPGRAPLRRVAPIDAARSPHRLPSLGFPRRADDPATPGSPLDDLRALGELAPAPALVHPACDDADPGGEADPCGETLSFSRASTPAAAARPRSR